jgi:hypothetical protein
VEDFIPGPRPLEFPPVISASLRSLFNSCHAKAYWSEIVGLRPKATSVHLTAGAAYAAALEAYRRTYYGSGPFPSEADRYDEAVFRGLEALIKAYGPNDPDPKEKKQFDRVVAAFVEYLYVYPPTTDHVIPSYSHLGPRVEFSFAFEIADLRHPTTGDPLLFAGRLDQLADFNGALFIFDDKTASSITQHWRRQWDLRSQFTGYAVGCQLHGLNVAGAIVRGMAILKESCNTAEAITFRPQWMIDRWKTRLVWDVKRMLDAWNNNYWPTTGEESGECTNYGLCPFTVLCTAEAPDRFTDVYFDQGRWDPIAREVKK